MQQPDVLQAKKILALQSALVLILSAAALPFGLNVALSALIGSAVCLVANSVFAFWVFRQYRAQEPGSVLMRFYGAEIVKLSLILGLFAVAFATIEGLNLPALLAAYFAVQVLPAVFAPA
jgi:ATP synthase protein I